MSITWCIWIDRVCRLKKRGKRLGKLFCIQLLKRGGAPRHSIAPASSEGFGAFEYRNCPSYKKNLHLTSEALQTTPYDDPATPYGDPNAVTVDRKLLHLMSLIELRIRLQEHINKLETFHLVLARDFHRYVGTVIWIHINTPILHFCDLGKGKFGFFYSLRFPFSAPSA